MRQNNYFGWFFITVLYFNYSLLVAQPTNTEWKDETVFRVNKEKPHAWFIPFQSIETARSGEASKSDQVLSLNGDWKFKYYETPNDVESGFESTGLKSGDVIVAVNGLGINDPSVLKELTSIGQLKLDLIRDDDDFSITVKLN